MLRIDVLNVRKEESSPVTYTKLKEIANSKLKPVSKEIYFKFLKDGTCLVIKLKEPIAFQFTSKIFTAFTKEGLKIKKVIWDIKEDGEFKTGYLSIIVS